MNKKITANLVLLFLILVCVICIAIVLILPNFFEFAWNDTLRTLLPNAEYFFRFITEFGGTLIYLSLFFTIYWGINKSLAKNLLLVYVASNFVNYYSKSIIGRSRPPESNWILISASHLSTPSGHAQSSSVVWGYVAIKSRTILIWIVSLVIIVLVGLSRMYLGVHWFGDILIGWLFSIIILSLVLIFEESIKNFVGSHNTTLIYLGLALLGFIIMVLSELLLSIDYNIGGPGGQLIGLGLGFAIEEKYIKFESTKNYDTTWKVIVRILLGILLIAIVYLVLYLIIDADIFWMSAIHNIITLLFGIVVWPIIFKKLNL
ncbi:MAG: phosphatase PAP2 family protein [Promethearchaeota archaeon]|nr:MAG: phosphatase PAP2 family protein [Candidatus Lokiarchaeota archaeon]